MNKQYYFLFSIFILFFYNCKKINNQSKISPFANNVQMNGYWEVTEYMVNGEDKFSSLNPDFIKYDFDTYDFRDYYSNYYLITSVGNNKQIWHLFWSNKTKEKIEIVKSEDYSGNFFRPLQYIDFTSKDSLSGEWEIKKVNKRLMKLNNFLNPNRKVDITIMLEPWSY